MADNVVAPDIRGLEAEAYGQGGFFRVDQARSRGVSSQLLRHYVRQGRFDHVRRGLYRITGFPREEHDAVRERWMSVGSDDAVVSNTSALALLDLSDVIPNSVHLLVPRRARGLRKPPGVTLHTRPDNDAPDVVWRKGLPVTAPARTLVDVLREVQPEQAELALAQALRDGLVTENRLRDEAGRRGRTQLLDRLLGPQQA